METAAIMTFGCASNLTLFIYFYVNSVIQRCEFCDIEINIHNFSLI